MTPANREVLSPSGPGGYGCLTFGRGNLPLKGMQIDGRIVGLFYALKVVQVFYNTFEQPIDCEYIFPLEASAAVTSFAVQVEGEVSRGVIKERGQARESFAAGAGRGHLTAMLEQERAEVFTASVANLPPGQAVFVAIELCGQLEFHRGHARFRFPLVVAPRYIPGMALDGSPVGRGVSLDSVDVPDASRISPPRSLPGLPNSVHLGFRLTIDDAGLGFGAVQTEVSGLAARGGAQGGLELVLSPDTIRMDRDFIISFPLERKTFLSSMVAHGGTYMVTIVPPALQQRQAFPLDLMVLLDLDGAPEWLHAGLESLLDRLRRGLAAEDRVGICMAGQSPRVLAPLAPRDQLSSPPVGFSGTASGNLVGGLAECFQGLVSAPGRRLAVLMLTSGLAGNEKQLLAMLSENQTVDLHAVVVGKAPNYGFLRWLCQAHGGVASPVDSGPHLEEHLKQLVSFLNPVLRQVEIEGQETEAPSGRNLFPGRPGFFLGRYEGPRPASVVVRGQLVDNSVANQTIPGADINEPVLEQLWTRAVLMRLECESVDKPDLHPQMVALSLKHGILCSQTALVAENERFTSQVRDRREVVVQPVEPVFEQIDMFAQDESGLFGSGEPAPAGAAPMASVGGDFLAPGGHEWGEEPAADLFSAPAVETGPESLGGADLFAGAPAEGLFDAAPPEGPPLRGVETPPAAMSAPMEMAPEAPPPAPEPQVAPEPAAWSEPEPERERAWSPTIEERAEESPELAEKTTEEMGWGDLLKGEQAPAPRAGLRRGMAPEGPPKLGGAKSETPLRGLIGREQQEKPMLMRRKSSGPETTSRLPLEGRVGALSEEKLQRLLDEVELADLARALADAHDMIVDRVVALLGPFRGRNLKLQLKWARVTGQEERAPARARVENIVSKLESE